MPSTAIPSRQRVGFTLIELMVVAAIIVVLMGVTLPTIVSLVRSNTLAQADNILRAALFSARTYAVHNSVEAGIRCQDDGRIVQIYARGTVVDSAGVRVLDMRAVGDRAPDQLPDPYRVTFSDVGAYSFGYVAGAGDMQTRWIGPTASGYLAAPEFLDRQNTWFAFPVVMFSPQGRVIFKDVQFSGSSSDPWFPTLTGSFAKATYCRADGSLIPNNNPIPAHDRVKFTNQPQVSGWRCNDYKGSASHDVPVEAPSLTSAPRLFDIMTFRNAGSPREAVTTIVQTSLDLDIEIETGMVVRRPLTARTN